MTYILLFYFLAPSEYEHVYNTLYNRSVVSHPPNNPCNPSWNKTVANVYDVVMAVAEDNVTL